MRTAGAYLSTYLDATTDGIVRHLVTFTPRTGSVARWTDHHIDLVVGGNTFHAGGEGTTYPIPWVQKRDEKAGVDIGSVTLELLCGSAALLNGVRMSVAAVQRALDGATVLTERYYPDCPAPTEADKVMHLFQGTVAGVEPTAHSVRVEVESGMAALRRPMPKWVFRPGCGNTLFDSQCLLVKATFTVTGTCSSGATTTSVPSSRTEATDYFKLGVITFTSGANNGLSRAVREYASSGGTFTLDRPLPVAPANGDTISVYPGCPKTLVACQTKFGTDNRTHFRATPYIPKVESGTTAPTAIRQAVDKIVKGTQWGTTKESSIYGTPLALVWGKNKVGGNVIYQGAPDLSSISTATRLDVMIALCEGEITGVGRVWRDRDVKSSPGDLGFSILTGTRPTQTAWANLPAGYSLGYPGIACAVGKLLLNGSSPPTMSWEVKGRLHGTGGSDGDAHPADVIIDFLSNADVGIGVDSSLVITDLGQDGNAASSCRRYTGVEGFWISPVLAEQREARDWLRNILDSINCEVLWSEGKYKILPLGDTAHTVSGVTYTPVTTVRYALTDTDLIAEPLSAELPPEQDAYNVCPVEFLERAPSSASGDPSMAYSASTAEDPDPVDVDRRGPSPASPEQFHAICLRDAALKISRIRAQRAVRARAKYTFHVPWRFARLEPLDIVTIESARWGLPAQPVRIISAEEEDGKIKIEAEEWEQGVTYAGTHTTQTSDGPTSIVPSAAEEVRVHELAARNWTTGTIATGHYYDVTWNGSVFCAVGNNVCATSPDGVTWTARTIPAGAYYSITWNGSKFLAVGNVSACATSPDGITWTARTIPSGSYSAAVWNGSIFVAVGGSPGTGKCATSSDGITWTARTIPGSYSYNGVAWNSSVFCAVGQNNLCATSPDGTTWTARTIPAGTYQDISWSGSMFCAVGLSAICSTSLDGITWTAQTVAGASGRSLISIAWTGAIFIVVDYSASVSNVYTSNDGVAWFYSSFAVPIPGSAVGWQITWSSRGGIMVGENSSVARSMAL